MKVVLGSPKMERTYGISMGFYGIFKENFLPFSLNGKPFYLSSKNYLTVQIKLFSKNIVKFSKIKFGKS